MLNGLIWYVMPMFVITINDIAAYMVGFFGGRTPLIELSPKKTKEGIFQYKKYHFLNIFCQF